jgi:large subunit ribosomal protein L13
MKTIFVNPKQIDRKWYIIDAEGQVLGRLSARIASILRGKHKPEYSPHTECGDYVVVINADKVAVTGKKMTQKLYTRHTGYPGGIRQESLEKRLVRRPEFPVENAVRGMLPHNRLGRRLFRNLKVYAGSEHPHKAQKPEVLEV